MIWKILAMVLYLIMMLIIGGAFYKKDDNLSDYILGGRGLGSWVTAMSAQASDMSGWLLMGLPGAIAIAGLGEAWIGIGLAVGTYLNWLFVAKRLRTYTEVAGDSLTIPEYLENRFKVNKSVMRVISGGFIFFFFLIYTASGFSAGGKLFEQVVGMNYQLAVIMSGTIIVVYTFMGGFKAVCWTDFVQGILMVLAIVIIPIIVIFSMGGLTPASELVAQRGPAFANLFKDMDGNWITALAIISSLAWGLGYCGMPHILVRFMAIKSPSMIKKSRRIATAWVVISLTCSILIGLLGKAYFGELLGKANSESVFIMLIDSLLPSFVAGVFLSAILAAIMSTADSQLLVVASAVSSDILPKVSKKEYSQNTLVWVSRLAIVAVAVIAVIIALDKQSSVMGLVSYAWAGFGAAFGPAVVLSLYWKRMTYKGALAGMAVGGVSVIVWESLKSFTQVAIFQDLYSLVPGFVLAFVTIVLVSAMDKEPEQAILEEFELVQQKLKEN